MGMNSINKTISQANIQNLFGFLILKKNEYLQFEFYFLTLSFALQFCVMYATRFKLNSGIELELKRTYWYIPWYVHVVIIQCRGIYQGTF